MTEPAFEIDGAQVFAGDCLDVLRGLPANSVDSVVTDPPYGLGNTTPRQVAETVTAWIGGDREFIPEGKGFMGRPWDAFVPPVAVWDECLRVLKPGGHALVFAGSRTQDLMGLALRLAGFDIRDSVMWLYGSGFPKSRNVDEAMAGYLAGDRTPAGPAPQLYEVTSFLRAARDAAGWSNKQIDGLFGTNGMAGHWTTAGSQPAVPSVRQWAILKDRLGFGDEMDHLVAELGSVERPEDWGKNGPDEGPFLGSLRAGGDLGASQGWGTALKPAFEPVVVARKPVVGSITANVRAYGTGAFNIDGCRVPVSDEDREAVKGRDFVSPEERGTFGAFATDGERRPLEYADGGRWPLNVCVDDSQAEVLDSQAPGELPARFFPTFRYEPKAPATERPKVDGVSHPTVKPLELMRWLVRLVTPPEGVVLEPFAGSGTTVEAAVLERFSCVAVERQPEYLPLIRARLTKPLEPVLDFGGLF